MICANFFREDAKTVRAVATYLSFAAEYTVQMTVEAGSFRILGGQWEVSRPTAELVCGKAAFPASLIGAEAYLSFRFPEDISAFMPKRIVRLVRDCVRGLIQAETWLLPERGFASDSEYDAVFDDIYQGGCRAYSHPHEDEETWMQYVGEYRREWNLFNRTKTFVVDRDETSGQLRVSGSFCDSFHEMLVRFAASAKTGEVISSDFVFKRAPMSICFSCEELAQGLVGMRLPLDKAQLAALAAGGEGCSHIFDLLCDLADESAEIYGGR